MVDSFFFPHKCEVKRSLGTTTNGKEDLEIVYMGECGYQPSNNAYNASGLVILSSPIVILPLNRAVFRAKDSVVVTVEKGREISASVKNFEDSEDKDVGGTILWLSMGEDDGEG